MQAEECKTLIREIFNSELKFEGHFDTCFDNSKETQQQELISWIKECQACKINVILSYRDKRSFAE